jgi:hypothetical protein
MPTLHLLLIAALVVSTSFPAAAQPPVSAAWLQAVLAQAEGEAEGEGEGTIDPPDCALDEFQLVLPIDDAAWYFTDTASGLDVVLRAEADCEDDVSSVSFFVRQGAGAVTPVGSPDNAAPYEQRLTSLFAPPLDQTLTFSARALRVSEPAITVQAEAALELITISADEDEDFNGLPDDPTTTLGGEDDRWLSRVQLDGEDDQVVTWMRTLYGTTRSALDDPLASFDVELRSPENTAQRLILTINPALVAPSEAAIFVVRMAPTLSALVSGTEELEFGREPGGALRGTGQYVLVSVLVSAGVGAPFVEIQQARLAASPIALRLEGLPLDAAREYSLARHAMQLSSLGAGLGIYAGTGGWRSVATQSTLYTENAITASITQPGVFAPYYLIEEGEFCPLGFCAPPIIIGELLAIIAFLILNLVPGGVGGGDSPCFIATAAYGTPLAADIDVLRQLRDTVLLESSAGSALVDTYYRVSPAIADTIARTPWLADIVRAALYFVVALTRVALYAPGAILAVTLITAALLFRAKRRTRPTVDI